MERRVADLLGLSVEQMEPLQLVRYQPGQQFKLHHDLGTILKLKMTGGRKRDDDPPEYAEDNDANGHNDDDDDDDSVVVELPQKSIYCRRRLATVFVYLTTGGGATWFPECTNHPSHDDNKIARSRGTRRSPRRHKPPVKTSPSPSSLSLHVQPVRGKAVLFCNIMQNGMPDPKTIHAGLPDPEQVKYGLNIWACED